jgi:hypothetical protein
MEQKSRKISNFHLTRSLHVGSKSEVHQGRFAQAGGVVQLAAVKVLRPRFACIGHELRNFLAEAGWATELRSPLFPRVFEAGEHNGNYFVAMEFVDGWTLAKILGSLATLQVPLPCEVGLAIAGQLTHGLHKMHEQREHDELLGLVHLGLNPENIMLSKEGQTKLLDFGMTIASADGEMSLPDDDGLVFQAPERRRGLPVDRRADVYSLGQVLKHMVECMVPEVVRSDIPALLSRACHKDPDQRFSSMKDFNVALKLVAKNRSLSPTRAACEKFTLEIFGHKVAKSDPRSRRPQPVVPLKMSSQGQKTSYEPVTPPPEARGGFAGVGAPKDAEATVVADARALKAAAMGPMDENAAVMGGAADVNATALGGAADINATALGGAADVNATALGAADVNATAMGGVIDSQVTSIGEVEDPEATAVGEPSPEKPTLVAGKASAIGELLEGMQTVPGGAVANSILPATDGEDYDSTLTVPGGAIVDGTATAIGAAPEAPRFLDEHLAVTMTGADPAPEATPEPDSPEPDSSQEVTAFSVPAVAGEEKKKSAKGGFREELIPTKPYASHNLDEDGA